MGGNKISDLGEARQIRYEALVRRALALAEKGRGSTSPNPLVGALVLQGDEVVGEGCHLRAGGSHAEVVALSQAGERARGGTLVATLEPCCHFGRTPPCVDAIMGAGIREVIVGALDPNPLVSGKGIERLRDAGVEVRAGYIEDEVARQNEAFFHYVRVRRPFVTLKVAATLDGKISFRSGARTQLTSLGAVERVHRLRRESDAVLVGIGTVLVDDPLLTVRLGPDTPGESPREDGGGTRGPIRVVLDSRGRFPVHSRLVKTAAQSPVLLATTELADPSQLAKLEAAGVEVLVLPAARSAANEEKVDLPALLDALGTREVVNLLVEGGAQVNASFVGRRLVDKFYFFLAPYLVRGSGAPRALAPGDSSEVEQLRFSRAEMVGPDLMVEAYPSREGAQAKDSQDEGRGSEIRTGTSTGGGLVKPVGTGLRRDKGLG